MTARSLALKLVNWTHIVRDWCYPARRNSPAIVVLIVYIRGERHCCRNSCRGSRIHLPVARIEIVRLSSVNTGIFAKWCCPLTATSARNKVVQLVIKMCRPHTVPIGVLALMVIALLTPPCIDWAAPATVPIPDALVAFVLPQPQFVANVTPRKRSPGELFIGETATIRAEARNAGLAVASSRTAHTSGAIVTIWAAPSRAAACRFAPRPAARWPAAHRYTASRPATTRTTGWPGSRNPRNPVGLCGCGLDW